MKDYSNFLTKCLLAIYLVGLYWIIILKLNVPHIVENRTLNWIPYAAPMVLNGKIDYGEMLLNVLIFVPLGVYSAVLFRLWTTFKHFFLFLSTSILLETLQWIGKLGSSDVTDVWHNTLGAVLGLFAYNFIRKYLGTDAKAQKWVNVLAVILTLDFILFIVYLKVNHLWMFRERTLFR